jgi:O-antigen/teichoic acid export membrane protein
MRLHPNNFWSLIEGLAGAIYQLCVISLITRYCGLFDVGQYGFAVAISAPIFMLLNMRLRFIYVSGRPECSSAFFSCFILRIITSTCAVALILIPAWILFPDIALILTAVTLFKYFESLSDFIYSLFHRCAEMGYIARSSMLSTMLSVAAAWFVFELGYGVLVALFSIALVKMAVFVLHDLRAALAQGEDWGITRVQLSWISKVILSLYPLGLLGLLSSYSFNAPRLFLGWSGDMESAGIYTGLSHLVLGGAILVNAVAFPLLRVLGESHMKMEFDVANRVVKNLMYASVLMGLASVVVVYLIGEELLLVLYGANFQGNWEAFILIALAGTLYYLVLVINHIGTSIGYFNRIVVWQGLSLALITIGLFVLAPLYGVSGGGIAWALGMGVQVALFLKVRKAMLSPAEVRAS